MKPKSWILIPALLLGRPLRAQGEPVMVTGVRGVTFGAILPGVLQIVSRTDPANSGEYEITGPSGSLILTFVLPAAMSGPAGTLLPLTFGSSDAGYSATQVIGSQVGFDPKQTFSATLPSTGRASVFIGGTVHPAMNQAAGEYTATLILNVTVLP